MLSTWMVPPPELGTTDLNDEMAEDPVRSERAAAEIQRATGTEREIVSH